MWLEIGGTASVPALEACACCMAVGTEADLKQREAASPQDVIKVLISA